MNATTTHHRHLFLAADTQTAAFTNTAVFVLLALSEGLIPSFPATFPYSKDWLSSFLLTLRPAPGNKAGPRCEVYKARRLLFPGRSRRKAVDFEFQPSFGQRSAVTTSTCVAWWLPGRLSIDHKSQAVFAVEHTSERAADDFSIELRVLAASHAGGKLRQAARRTAFAHISSSLSFGET